MLDAAEGNQEVSKHLTNNILTEPEEEELVDKAESKRVAGGKQKYLMTGMNVELVEPENYG